MAILGRFNISVCVDGQPLPEHDGPSPANVIDEEAFHSCHKFVQVPDSDKDYYMRFEQAVPREIPAGEVVLLRVVVDGKKRQGLTVTDTAQMDLPVLGTFARVETTEDADQATVERDRATAEALGVIQIWVWRAIRDEVTPAVMRNPCAEMEPHSRRNPNGSFAIAEKAVKGREVSFRTVFPPVPAYLVCYYERLGPPLAFFAFSYQSREALQRSGIIPQDRLETPVEPLDRKAPWVKQEEPPPRPSIKRPREAFDLTGDGVVPMEVPAPYRSRKRQAVVNLSGNDH